MAHQFFQRTRDTLSGISHPMFRAFMGVLAVVNAVSGIRHVAHGNAFFAVWAAFFLVLTTSLAVLR